MTLRAYQDRHVNAHARNVSLSPAKQSIIYSKISTGKVDGKVIPGERGMETLVPNLRATSVIGKATTGLNDQKETSTAWL